MMWLISVQLRLSDYTVHVAFYVKQLSCIRKIIYTDRSREIICFGSVLALLRHGENSLV